MTREEALALIERLESSSEYIFYRDMYLTIERAKAAIAKAKGESNV